MNEAAQEAAFIMRTYSAKTQGEIFSIAKARAVTNENGKGAFLDPDGDAAGHAWAVVDAHYDNREEPGYRVAAALPPILVEEDA
jgi:hypothetical protein